MRGYRRAATLAQARASDSDTVVGTASPPRSCTAVKVLYNVGNTQGHWIAPPFSTGRGINGMA